MASRPQNIGIKAIEIYFPSQVRALCARGRPLPLDRPLPARAVSRWQGGSARVHRHR